MTQEELKQMLNLIISKCDNLINNNLYTADDFTQCNVEDIAEMCNLALDGKFGELPSLLSDLDEAAEEIAKSEIPVVAGEALDLNGDCYETDDINWPERCGFIRGFKAGAEWMAGQGETCEADVKEDAGGYPYIPCIELYNYDKEEPLFKEGDKVVVQIRKKQ